MKNDVFISYSSKDKHTADAVCSTLENNGIRCWIAPRDIFPGSDWAQSIINAIKSSKIMVLIFSQNSNGSSQVTKELNLAVSHNLMVVPFKIDDSLPSGSMEYFLADMHWLDAIDGDMQEQINKLRDVIASIMPHNMKDDEASDHISSKTEIRENSGVSVQSDIKTENPTIEKQIKFNDENKTESSEKKRMGLFQAYKRLWQKCFDYSGCATRTEYWKAVLMNAIVSFIVLIINILVMSNAPTLIMIYIVAVSVPFISIGVRRLHDTNHSGHWMWLMLTGYGSVVPLVFFCIKSVSSGNRFKTI